MKKFGKMILTLPIWLPAMFLGATAYTVDQFCDGLLTRIGEWINE